MTYNYTFAANTARLTKEIAESSITIALDRIDQPDTSTQEVQIIFKATLSTAEQATLDALVTAHQPIPLASPAQEVTTQFEKNDRTLQCVFAYGLTDANGAVEARFPIPAAGRFLAYGDAEFEVRHFFDRITGILVRDDDRLIAWQAALAGDPGATEPLPDAVIQSLTAEQLGGVGPFPHYPILGGFEDQDLTPGPALYENGPPQWGPGMTMTFQYGGTEVGPVGGYAFVDGNFYFVITAQKGERCPANERAGIALQVSIDGVALD